VALDGPYSFVRPAIGPDGTVYAVDAYSTLYAVAPSGALSWKVAGAGNKGVAAGADGTVYVGSEGAVRAYAPDGTLRWSFTQSPRAFIFLGLAVGPDGNLYGVGTQGLGAFSLTAAGALRWAVPEPYARPIVDYGEIVFASGAGATQLAFYANAHVRSLDLAGNDLFTVGGGSQPAAAPDGTFRLTDRSYGLDGALRWDSALGSGGPPTVGPDGTSFFVFLSSELDAVDAAGRTRFVATSADWLGDPTAHPAGGLVLLGSIDAVDGSGALQARSTADGTVLWRLALPAGQHVDTRPGFSADGSTAYLVTAQSSLPQGAWLTAVSVR
jgi:hypothetical protein